MSCIFGLFGEATCYFTTQYCNLQELCEWAVSGNPSCRLHCGIAECPKGADSPTRSWAQLWEWSWSWSLRLGTVGNFFQVFHGDFTWTTRSSLHFKIHCTDLCKEISRSFGQKWGRGDVAAACRSFSSVGGGPTGAVTWTGGRFVLFPSCSSMSMNIICIWCFCHYYYHYYCYHYCYYYQWLLQIIIIVIITINDCYCY